MQSCTATGRQLTHTCWRSTKNKWRSRSWNVTSLSYGSLPGLEGGRGGAGEVPLDKMDNFEHGPTCKQAVNKTNISLDRMMQYMVVSKRNASLRNVLSSCMPCGSREGDPPGGSWEVDRGWIPLSHTGWILIFQASPGSSKRGANSDLRIVNDAELSPAARATLVSLSQPRRNLQLARSSSCVSESRSRV